MIRFAAPWERPLRVATAVLLGVLLSVGLGVLALGLSLSGPSPELLYPFALTPAVMLVVVATTWLLAPRGFAIDDGALTVERRARAVRIPVGTIRAVGLLPEGLGGALRLGGNGGLFGYSGRYWSRRLGAFRLYATRRTELVRVETDDEVFVLSPAEPERFVEALLDRAPRARAASADGDRRPLRLSAARALRGVALVAAGVALLLGGLLSAMWGFAPTSVSLVEGAVRIERRWATAVELPLVEIHRVETLAPQYDQGWWRINGTSLGTVRYGRFGSQRLGEFRLFAWSEGPYVLLETGQGRVIITPADGGAFVRELRGRLAAR